MLCDRGPCGGCDSTDPDRWESYPEQGQTPASSDHRVPASGRACSVGKSYRPPPIAPLACSTPTYSLTSLVVSQSAMPPIGAMGLDWPISESVVSMTWSI